MTVVGDEVLGVGDGWEAGLDFSVGVTIVGSGVVLAGVLRS